MALVSCHVYIIEYVCSIATAFLKLARMVHSVISILPPETVDSFEREELDWEPRSKVLTVFLLQYIKGNAAVDWLKWKVIAIKFSTVTLPLTEPVEVVTAAER